MRKSEAGFALILAMLALILLTFLGLTLTLTTSTELQIASNYRWSQQALYNAEAGIEIGKRYLQETEWRTFLPDARGGAQMNVTPPPQIPPRNGAGGEASRNFENSNCDTAPCPGVGCGMGGQGYGVVFDAPNFASPFQNTSAFLGQTLNGSFTIWVRRPLVYDQATLRMIDYAQEDRIVMTVEGTAPQLGASALTVANRAIRIMESQLQKIDPGDCENYSGQQGNGPGGTGYDPCSFVKEKGVPSGGGLVTSSAAGRQ